MHNKLQIFLIKFNISPIFLPLIWLFLHSSNASDVLPSASAISASASSALTRYVPPSALSSINDYAASVLSAFQIGEGLRGFVNGIGARDQAVKIQASLLRSNATRFPQPWTTPVAGHSALCAHPAITPNLMRPWGSVFLTALLSAPHARLPSPT